LEEEERGVESGNAVVEMMMTLGESTSTYILLMGDMIAQQS
jgi:hypothetical protein